MASQFGIPGRALLFLICLSRCKDDKPNVHPFLTLPTFPTHWVDKVKVHPCVSPNVLPPFSIGLSGPSSVCRVSPYLSGRPHLPRGFVTLCHVKKKNGSPGVLLQGRPTLRWLSLSYSSYRPLQGPCNFSSCTHLGSVSPCSSTHVSCNFSKGDLHNYVLQGGQWG